MPPWNARVRAAALMEKAKRLLEEDDSPKQHNTNTNHNQHKQKQTGGGTKHAGVTHPTTLTGSQCKCCGRKNHVKSQCYHKDKACDICGKTGHVRAVCRHADADAAAAAKATAGTAPKKDANVCSPCNDTPVVLKVPWTCRKCHAQCTDDKLNKCEKCHELRMKVPKPTPAPPPQPKP